MVDKRDISKLLKKGLTGWETGLLVLEDSWLESRNQEHFLTDRDISNLKAGLKTQEDIRDYNRLIQLFRTADFIERQAMTTLLAAASQLERAAGLGYLRWAPIMAQEILRSAPQIMTEKQFREERQAVMDRQRQRKLQELESMYGILSERASKRAPEGWLDEWSQLPDEETLDADAFLQEKYPEAWPQARQDILEMLKAGKLKPVQLSSEDIGRLKSLDEQSQAYRDRRWPPGQTKEEQAERAKHRDPPGWTREDDVAWNNLIEQTEAFRREAYQRAKKSGQGQDILISLLEQLKAGSLAGEEEDRLLDYTFCLGEDLYQSGLPEWKEQIDTYYEDWYERDLSESDVAIIPKPRDSQLDERGYYNREHFARWPFAPPMEEDDFAEAHSGATEMATEEIGKLLASRQVLREVSHYIGLALDEATNLGIWALLEPAIARYNTLADSVSGIDRWPFEQYQKLKHIHIEWKKMRPPAKRLAEVRDWISESLGEQWWKRAETEHREPRSLLSPPKGQEQLFERYQQEKEAEHGS